MRIKEVAKKTKSLLKKVGLEKKYWTIEHVFRNYSSREAIEWAIYSEEDGISFCRGNTAENALGVLKEKVEYMKLNVEVI